MTDIDFNGLVVLKFYATWCEPCKRLSTIVSKMEKEFPNVKLYNVDIDVDFDLAKKHTIMSVPTMVFLNDGKEKTRLVGMTKTEIVRKAFKLLSE